MEYNIGDKVKFTPQKIYTQLISDYNSNNIFTNHIGTIKEIKKVDIRYNKEDTLLYIQWDNINDLLWEYTHITPSNITKIM